MTYHFPTEGFVPEIKPHGNSTIKKEPFHPTWSSTKQHIKQKCIDTGPKHVISSVSAVVGGVLGASAPGQLPRDEKQVTNFKAKETLASRSSTLSIGRDAAADDLFLVMQKAYSEDPSKRFVRAVNAAPEPAIVVSTDRQLQDLSRFCCNSFEFCPLTVDPTFCLGSFDVTLITYRHLLLQSKRYGNPPIFIGPCCIHYKKSFATYLFFASTIIGQCSHLEGVRVIGTDGEKALIDAFKHEFGFAQHLTCFIHVRRNIKDKLHECNIPSHLSIEILDDIFGKTMGTTRVEGLVDACSGTDFQEKFHLLVEKWQDAALPSSADIDGFLSWFQIKSAVIEDTMLSTIREECGLGCPPIPFTTNACEAANSMLKSHTKYKRSEIFEFLQKLKELITEQDREIERAIIGRGKYELRPQYHSLSILESKWFIMSTSQRELHLKKFSNTTVCETSSLSDDTLDQSLTTCLGRDLTPASSLSVSIDALAGSVRIPLNCLEGIWNKAAELLKTDGAIVSAPGVGTGAKYVLSYTRQKPHLVVPKKGGSYSCDQDCPNWKALKICSHSVAVAEICGKLTDFITWYKKLKHTPNVSKFAQATMPKGRGQKGTRAPHTRKPSLPVEQVLKNPGLSSSESICNSQASGNLNSYSVSEPDSQVASQVNNFQLPVVEHVQTISPSPGIYQPPAILPPQTWMHSSNQWYDNWTWPTSIRPRPHTPVSHSFFEYNYSTPVRASFTPPTHAIAMPSFEGNYASSPLSNSDPFILCKISGNIKVCAGCRNKYPKSPSPPHDMCIKHQEWREYFPEGTKVSKYRFGNAYYHFNSSCVKLRHPQFAPHHLQVPTNLELSEAHKEFLQCHFSIFV